MAEVHLSINGANRRFMEEERRYNSTTPKSFLELIGFYVRMLTERKASVGLHVGRLERGLDIMHRVQENVAVLRADLRDTLAMVEDKKVGTEELIRQVTEASLATREEQDIAGQEREKCSALAAEAQRMKALADRELVEAMPAMEDAKKAIDCLDKNAITELKSMQKPPVECVDVCAACGFLLKNERRKLDWKGCTKMLQNPPQFLEEVKAFDANVIPEQALAQTDLLIAKPHFNFETMKGKSYAAACLANWVVNIVMYHKIYQKVEPLMQRVNSATLATQRAEAALAVVQRRLQEVEENGAALDRRLSQAVSEKERVEEQATRCQQKLLLAERLVSGLTEENERWTRTVAELRDLGLKLIGNCLLASAFVGYISPFSARLRQELRQTWTKDSALALSRSRALRSISCLASLERRWRGSLLRATVARSHDRTIARACARAPSPSALGWGPHLRSPPRLPAPAGLACSLGVLSWRTEDLVERRVPMTERIDPLTVLATAADIASWQNEARPETRGTPCLGPWLGVGLWLRSCPLIHCCALPCQGWGRLLQSVTMLCKLRGSLGHAAWRARRGGVGGRGSGCERLARACRGSRPTGSPWRTRAS